MTVNRSALTQIARWFGLLTLLIAGSVYAQQYPPALGFLGGGNQSYSRDITPNGQIVVGGATPDGGTIQAFYWKAETGLQSLHSAAGAPVASWALAVSEDGQAISGTANYQGTFEAFRWTPQSGMQPLGVLSGLEESQGVDISADGSVVVGQSIKNSAQFKEEAFRWSAAGGLVPLGQLTGYHRSYANAVSGDGTVIVGGCRDTTQSFLPTQAYRWTQSQGMTALGYLPGHNWSSAQDVSRDGSAIAGWSRLLDNSGAILERKGFLWTADSGMVDLGTMPGATNLRPGLISGDGTIIIGYANSSQYFIWDDSLGMRELQQALTNEYGIVLSGWSNLRVEALVGANRRIKYLAGQGTNPSGETEAWRLPPIRILEPLANERWMVEEEKTIRWQSGASEFFLVEFSTDSGRTFSEIGQVIHGDQDTLWRVPDSLRTSSKVRIRVSDLFDTTCAEISAPLIIKAYDLVRERNDGSLQPYYPDQHGWPFSNNNANMWPASWWSNFDYLTGIDPYTGKVYDFEFHFKYKARSSFFPDWPLWVKAYGTDINYWSTTLAIYSGRAQRYWRSKHHRWSGSCYGFATSSLLAFRYPDYFSARFPDLPQVDSLYAVALDDTSREVVNEYYIHCYGRGYYAYVKSVLKSVTPRMLLSQIRNIFGDENLEPTALTFHDPDTSGAHTVLPYLLKREAPGSKKFRLYVYDPNNPGSRSQYIEIDSLNNTWKTSLTNLSWGPGETGCFLDLPANAFMQQPFFKFDGLSGASGESGDLEISLPPGSDALLTNPAGQSIGHAGNAIVNTLEDAIPIMPLTGTNAPPLGFVVPQNRYDISFSNVPDSQAYVSVMDDSLFYSYERGIALPGETDRLAVEEGLGILNPGSVSRRLRLGVLASMDNNEQDVEIDRILIDPGDSLHLEMISRGSTRTPMRQILEQYDLRLVNSGAAGEYDLRLRYAASDTVARFAHGAIPLEANATHIIVPPWENILSVPTLILIDLNSDGTIDDSLLVSNQPLGLDEELPAVLPASFALHQNYPNPFNPATTIRYDLPENARVTLKIFDLLGREVRTLVDSRQVAGSKVTVWDGRDAKGQMVSSGIYIYQLQANSYLQNRKMILLR